MSLHRFDHRYLLRTEPGDQSQEHSPIEAIYLCTKGRNESARAAVAALEGLNVPVNVLASTIDDFTDISMVFPDLDIRIVRPSSFDSTSSLLTHRFSHEASRFTEWDLHVKRNYALASAKAAGLKRILLLDDDISGVGIAQLEELAKMLDSVEVAGFFIEGYDDNSVVGHLCRQVGLPQTSFISGSCLGVNVEAVTSFFPPIYNEDWLFMLPSLVRKQVGLAGVVKQAPGPKPSLVANATFQEFGDVLAEGAFSALTDDPSRLYDPDHWASYLRERAGLLNLLMTRFTAHQDLRSRECRRAVADAQRTLETVLPLDCVSYMRMLVGESERWHATACAGDTRKLMDSVSVRPRNAKFDQPGVCKDGLWSYPDGATVTIVCPTLPKPLRSPFADRNDRNFNGALTLGDLDAAIEILSAIKAESRYVKVQIRSADDLDTEMLAGDLVLVGGVSWNLATARFMKLLDVPVKQRTDGPDDTFLVSENGMITEHSPKDEGDSVLEDVALFVRAKNPYGRSTRVVICNGVLSRGVLGIARAFTHPHVAAVNSHWVREQTREATYCALVRVPVFAGEVIAPDLTRKENRLFEWSAADGETQQVGSSRLPVSE